MNKHCSQTDNCNCVGPESRRGHLEKRRPLGLDADIKILPGLISEAIAASTNQLSGKVFLAASVQVLCHHYMQELRSLYDCLACLSFPLKTRQTDQSP